VNTKLLAGFAVPVVILIAVVAVVALFAGTSYALVALLLGVVIIGGLAAGGVVAQADEAPFETDEATEAGDTPEHSSSSSASETPAR
jgi:hypothetical protein